MHANLRNQTPVRCGLPRARRRLRPDQSSETGHIKPTAMNFATSERWPLMIFRSPHPDVQIPNVPLTPFVLRHAARLADKPAIIDGLTGHGFTYGELAAAVRTVASALAERGLRKGDVFAIYAPNSPEYAIAFHAVVSLDGIVTTVNPAANSEELTDQLIDAGATYLLTAAENLDRAIAAASESP